jgi:hypothetical protein
MGFKAVESPTTGSSDPAFVQLQVPLAWWVVAGRGPYPGLLGGGRKECLVEVKVTLT